MPPAFARTGSAPSLPLAGSFPGLAEPWMGDSDAAGFGNHFRCGGGRTGAGLDMGAERTVDEGVPVLRGGPE